MLLFVRCTLSEDIKHVREYFYQFDALTRETGRRVKCTVEFVRDQKKLLDKFQHPSLSQVSSNDLIKKTVFFTEMLRCFALRAAV